MITTQWLVGHAQMLLLCLGAVMAFVLQARGQGHALVNGLTLILLSLALGVHLIVAPTGSPMLSPLIAVDDYARFFNALILFSALVVSLLAHAYFGPMMQRPGLFYACLQLATFGAMVMAGSQHFFSFFLGLELFSVCLYLLIGGGGRQAGNEGRLTASLSYLLLSGLATAFLLMGMALLYLETGTLVFTELGNRIVDERAALSPLSVLGLMLVLSSLAFKLSIVPFHLWTPDIFDQAPMPVTAFMATVTRIALLAAMLRMLMQTQVHQHELLLMVMTVLAAGSMLIGHLLALWENNLKRLMAFVTIAQQGHLLLILTAAAYTSAIFTVEAAGVYIFTYVLSSLAFLTVLTACSQVSRECRRLEQLHGLFFQQPWTATALIIALFSLAGVPLTLGFIAKFYVVNAGIEGGQWLLLVLFFISMGLGLFYTLRVVSVLLGLDIMHNARDTGTRRSPAFIARADVRCLLLLLCLILLGLGLYPEPLINVLYSLSGQF